MRLYAAAAVLSTLVAATPISAAGPVENFEIYGVKPTSAPSLPVPARPGPHLLVDDFLIASSTNLARVVNVPRRDPGIPNPLITGEGDGCFQPYFTVLRDPEAGRFRLWVGARTPDRSMTRSRLAYTESQDGVHWEHPPRILKEPAAIQFGSEVLDRGSDFPDPSARYVYSYYLETGLRLAVSRDGLEFRPLADRVVLAHNHDINNVSYDPLRKRYVATVSSVMRTAHSDGERRTTLQSVSADLLNWSEPAIVLCASSKFDEGDTQFYGMNGFLTSGSLRLGMVKVLRDDLFSDPPEVLAKRNGGSGTGYTTLAWTRDGVTWTRDRAVFMDRGPGGSWDRSHAWVDEQVVVGDRVYLYYAGYKSGHKANRFTDRQIGLVTIPLDRYVSREPAVADAVATLTTVPLELPQEPTTLVLNADAKEGSIRVRLLDAVSMTPLPDYTFEKCEAMTDDSLRHVVRWGSGVLPTRPVRLQFELKGARLFAFDLRPAEPRE